MQYQNNEADQKHAPALLSRREVLAAGAGVPAAHLIAGATVAGQTPEVGKGTDQMKTRKLGRLEVSELGFGNMGLSGGHYGPGVDRASA